MRNFSLPAWLQTNFEPECSSTRPAGTSCTSMSNFGLHSSGTETALSMIISFPSVDVLSGSRLAIVHMPTPTQDRLLSRFPLSSIEQFPVCSLGCTYFLVPWFYHGRQSLITRYVCGDKSVSRLSGWGSLSSVEIFLIYELGVRIHLYSPIPCLPVYYQITWRHLWITKKFLSKSVYLSSLARQMLSIAQIQYILSEYKSFFASLIESSGSVFMKPSSVNCDYNRATWSPLFACPYILCSVNHWSELVCRPFSFIPFLQALSHILCYFTLLHGPKSAITQRGYENWQSLSVYFRINMRISKNLQ